MIACQQDSGLDIVRVPQSAYLAPDAAKPPAVVAEAGASDAGAFMVCVDAPGAPDDDKEDSEEAKPEGEMSDDFPDCPVKYEGRPLDPRTTQRHREHDGERACCYRTKGSQPQPLRRSGGE